ncbi:MAG: hypothetical protein KAX49_20720 [Halanaerobiales bacterium]|nr:hypothetical protein [Halanaerobiales bacterium]
MKHKDIKLQCSNCGLILDQPQVRCPRCNTSLREQLTCNGDCKSCKEHK